MVNCKKYLIKNKYGNIIDADHWAYNHFISYVDKMLTKIDYFTCVLPYTLSLHHGLLSQKRVDAMMEDENLSEIDFKMEFEGIFYKSNDNALIKSTDILPTRMLQQTWIAPTQMEVMQEKDNKKKSWAIPKLSTNEVRILSADIAMMKSTTHANDNSIFTLIRGIPKNEEYIKQLLYMESCEGEKATTLALRIKQLYYQSESDYISIDAGGLGLSVVDSLGEYTYDPDLDITYPPMKSFNDDRMAERCGYEEAVPVLFTIKATKELNHDIALNLKNTFQKKTIQLPVHDLDGKDYLIENKGFLKKDSEAQARMLATYTQTTALQNELINLEAYIYKGYLRVYEKSGKRKDRYSSLAYNLFLFKQLEKNLRKPDKVNDFICFW